MAIEDQPTLHILIFLSIFCIHFLTASARCSVDDVYVIRSYGPNNHAVDGTEPDKITIQQFTGSKNQSWKFQPADRPGSYYIINENHGKALDFELRDDGAHYLILTDKKEKSVQQLWNFNHKGNIVNFASGKNIDIVNAIFNPGNHLIAWEDNGCSCQRFFLHRKE